MMACWYLSVDIVFDIGEMHCSVIAAWISFLVIDIALNLNTVRVIRGKSLRNRWAITLEYLRYESFLDLSILAYLGSDQLNINDEVKLPFHLMALVALLIKLSKKAGIIKASFAFKKYIGLIDSVLILIVASHTNVLVTAT